jgi:hypothetical protein
MRVFYVNLKASDVIIGSTNSDNGVTLHNLCMNVQLMHYGQIISASF